MNTQAERYLSLNILNEKQPITYRLLSRAIGVSVSDAKHLLYNFYEVHKKRNSNLHATFAICGKPLKNIDNDESNLIISKCVLCPEEKLEDEKRNFKLISSIHLYSIEPSSINDSSYFSGVSQRIQQEYDENLNDEKREIYGMIKAPKTLQASITKSKNKTISIPIPQEKKKVVTKSDAKKITTNNNDKTNNTKVDLFAGMSKYQQIKARAAAKRSETAPSPITASNNNKNHLTDNRKSNSRSKSMSLSESLISSRNRPKKVPKEKVIISKIENDDDDDDDEMIDQDEIMIEEENRRQLNKKKQNEKELQKLFDDDDDIEIDLGIDELKETEESKKITPKIDEPQEESIDDNQMDIDDEKDNIKDSLESMNVPEPQTENENENDDNNNDIEMDLETTSPPHTTIKTAKMTHKVDERGYLITTFEDTIVEEPPKNKNKPIYTLLKNKNSGDNKRKNQTNKKRGQSTLSSFFK